MQDQTCQHDRQWILDNRVECNRSYQGVEESAEHSTGSDTQVKVSEARSGWSVGGQLVVTDRRGHEEETEMQEDYGRRRLSCVCRKHQRKEQREGAKRGTRESFRKQVFAREREHKRHEVKRERDGP